MTAEQDNGGGVDARAKALFSALDELVNWLDKHADLMEIRAPEGMMENARKALRGGVDLWDTQSGVS
ncbi:MAG: hypothetical protein GY906_22375 [bacterium]|nr:hypothetical protein [bacterium]